MTPRILITRSPHQASELADALRTFGAEPILIPTIETVEPTTYGPLDDALAQLDTFHWLLFTSANAVDSFWRRLPSDLEPRLVERMDGRAEVRPFQRVGVLKVAAIGQATARALEAVGMTPDLIPPQAVAESFGEALLPFVRQTDGAPTRFLLVRAEQAREYLPETLRAAGADVTVAPAYRTVTPAGSLEALRELLTNDPPDAVTFTSSSTAQNLFELLAEGGLELPETVVRASIGPITSLKLRELGWEAQVEAQESTVQKVAEALMLYFSSK